MTHQASYPDPTGRGSSSRDPSLFGNTPPGGFGDPLEPGAPPPGLASTPSPVELLRALRRRWVAAILLGGTLAVMAAVGAWFLLKPKHTAFTRLLVKNRPPNIMRTAQQGPNRTEFGTYLRTKAAQITSRPVIWDALKREEVKKLHLEDRHKDPVAFVEHNLHVDFQDTNEVMTIHMQSSDPYEALTLVKGITGSFMDRIVYSERQARVRQVTELEKVYNQNNDDLKTKKANLRKLARTLGVTDPFRLAQQRLQFNETIRDARQHRNRVSLELIEAQAQLEAFEVAAEIKKRQQKQAAPQAKEDVDQAITEDAQVQQLSDRHEKLRQMVLEDLQRGALTSSPTVIAARARLQSIRMQIDRRKNTIRSELAQRKKAPGAIKAEENGTEELVRAQLTNRIKTLKELHEKLENDVQNMVASTTKLEAQTIPEHEALKDEIERQEKVVDELGQRLEKEKVELRSTPRISIYQDADLQPKDTKKQLLATAGAPVVVFIGVCLALAWFEYRLRRVRSANEVARGLGIQVIGAVPRLPSLSQIEDPVEELEGHPALESVDALRTLLLRDARSRNTRLVMVSSATEREGKTTLASHLAFSLARAGRKTLLLDADLRNSMVHELFDLPLQPGFSEVLLGEVEVADAVQPTLINDLGVMTAGHWDREVLQALARGGLEAVFDKLQQEFDFIILDSHPVLHATDSLLLGQQVDAVVLAVMREVSQSPRVYAAASRLSSLGIRVLGAVLNGTDPEEVFTPVVPSIPVAA